MYPVTAGWRAFMYAPDDGAGAAAAAGTATASEPATEPVGEPASRTFTQDELNHAVEQRLARERKKYEGFEDLRTKAEQFDRLQEEQMSEIEKANKRVEKAEAKARERVGQADTRLIQAAVLAEATKHRAIRPEHLFKLIDRENVTVGDDGQVTGVEDAVKAFLDANPEYVGSSRPTTGFADQGARPAAPSQQTFDSVIRQRAAH